ncbi:alpha/beta hydrolase [bacterium]|nr:alpha/beta hydrolase [bacterium]
MSWPSTGNDFTTIILIQGGGSHDRDYTIFRHKPFLVLSNFLTKQGFAVLRWDERGVGNSTGNGMSATSADFAKVVLSAIDFLKKSPLFKTNNIGLIGHSEGGNVASETAKINRDVSFIILLGCPGLPGDQYQCQFEESTARAMGLSEESIEKRIILQLKILEIVLEEPNNDTVEMKLKTLFKTLNPNFTDQRLNQAIARFLSPWFQHNAKYDPEKTLLQVNCPILAIYGEKDLHVPPEGNVEVIQKVINKTNCRQSKVVVLPNLNHFFRIM